MKNCFKKGFLFSFLIVLKIQAQSTKVYDFYYDRFSCKNPKGLIEYLKIGKKKQKIFYATSKNSEEDIPLKILNPNATFLDYYGEGTKVQFPNDNKIYILKVYPSCENFIECHNPDGTVQKFEFIRELGGTYRCINLNNTIEYLYINYINSKNLKVKYSSNKNPRWVTLKVSNIKINTNAPVFLDYEYIEQFEVQFPNAPQKYIVIIPQKEENIEFPIVKVKNPDGTVQTFQWINKE